MHIGHYWLVIMPNICLSIPISEISVCLHDSGIKVPVDKIMK